MGKLNQGQATYAPTDAQGPAAPIGLLNVHNIAGPAQGLEV